MHHSRELDTLQATLNEAIDAVREELSAQRLPPMTTSGARRHPLDDREYVVSPRMFEARKLALGQWIQGQLRNILQVPYDKVVEQSFAVYDTACLDIVVKTGIVDTISEHTNGCSITQVSNALSLDPRKVSTVLRHLAAQGWFIERAADVYTLSRAGLELCRGKHGRTWLMIPRHDKIASSLLDMITHSEWKMSTSILHSAFQLSHQTHMSYFEYLKHHPIEMENWSRAVHTYGNVHEEAMIADYSWQKLNPGIFVDCGGSQGFLAITLAKHFPESTFIVQDLPEMVPAAERNFLLEDPEAVREGRLLAETHDFSQPQPRSADVYTFRHIFHDWADAECVTILQNVIKTAPMATILIIDLIVAPSTYPPEDNSSGVTLRDLQGADKYHPVTPPPFIPENFGAASKTPLALGVHVMGSLNSWERTLPEWRTIIDAAGLRIASVNPLRATMSVIECRIK
ncbi:S-adenosyl-L-methionine-dependent methyltransferase [Mycena crocata]|nr:S-adenosyl-L-methionine-dependent methyltransferase [Mycena crocata]